MAKLPVPISSTTTPPNRARSSAITRATAFANLPDWLSRDDVCHYAGISLASADRLIHKLPRCRFGKHIRVSKYFFSPDAPAVLAAARDLLGCSERSLRARVARQTIPFKKLSGRVVFRREALERFLENLPGCSVEEALKNVEARRS